MTRRWSPSLKALGLSWMLIAFGNGLVICWMWFASETAWKDHLTSSMLAGIRVYEALRIGLPPPEGVSITPLGEQDARYADAGRFERIAPAPMPAYVTNASIMTEMGQPLGRKELELGIVSDNLRYQLADLSLGEHLSAAEKFGALTQLLAGYCSEPIIFARAPGDGWSRIDGTAIWGCAAAPPDLRLPVAIVAFIVLVILGSHIAHVAGTFSAFAGELKARRHIDGPESYSTEGPAELRDIVASVNAYLEVEREQLSRRAVILSGVSHDLGTPATRLRLRAALIEDETLRAKLTGDIDLMTGMIESVLTYTRSELSIEAPRPLSLTSLVEAVIADYQDMDKPVSLRPATPRVVTASQSLFSTRAGQFVLPDEQQILVTARPISLRRAMTNLIDNAIKYGRRANIELHADAETATLVVEDEGSHFQVADIEALFAPFHRGENARAIGGYGLGLTIVSTVARQHNGELQFEAGPRGLRAILTIARS